jgi:GT2 family glycosyltransferase
MIEASVIIPFFGDQKSLKVCLASLRRIVSNSSNIEIVVVDNHPEPKLQKQDYTGIVLCHESIPGSYAARNKGIKVSKGEFLFFTDADTVVDAQYLKMGLKRLKEKSILYGGRIELTYHNKHNPRSLELYEKMFYFQQKFYVEVEGYGATANLFGPRDIFIKLNGFDSSLRSGGDQDFCRRAQEEGVEINYADEVIVFHPSRYRFKEFLVRRLRAFSGNLYLFYRQRGLNKKMVKEKIGHFLNQEKFYEWNADWDFYNSLSKKQQKSIRRWHRVFSLVDVLTLLACKANYRRLKSLTLIDRRF